jgi:hypothetical protein
VSGPNSYFSSCFFTQCSFFPFFVLSVASFNSMSLLHTHCPQFFYILDFPILNLMPSFFIQCPNIVINAQFCTSRPFRNYSKSIEDLLATVKMYIMRYAQMIWETLRTHRFSACLRLFSVAASWWKPVRYVGSKPKRGHKRAAGTGPSTIPVIFRWISWNYSSSANVI